MIPVSAHVRSLAAVALIALLSALSVAAAANAGGTPTTKITNAVVHPAARSARFAFTVRGTGKKPVAVEFFCGLVRHGYLAGPPSSCMSPASYTKLPKGSYTFSVYAQVSGGQNTNVATDDFQIS
jgi:hypothetical protein